MRCHSVALLVLLVIASVCTFFWQKILLGTPGQTVTVWQKVLWVLTTVLGFISMMVVVALGSAVAGIISSTRPTQTECELEWELEWELGLELK